MAENPSGPADPFDVKRIHYLVRLMKHYDLAVLDLTDGPAQIRLRRRGPEAASPTPVAPFPQTPGPAVAPRRRRPRAASQSQRLRPRPPRRS